MVDVKPPHLADLEIESMKEIYPGLQAVQYEMSKKNCYWKCSNFYSRNSSNTLTPGQYDWKRESYGLKNAKMEKYHQSLDSYLQYVDDFKFWDQTREKSLKESSVRRIGRRMLIYPGNNGATTRLCLWYLSRKTISLSQSRKYQF